jgi:phosphohistidine phosphatase
MKTLLLIRHAKSSWDDAGITDFDRPLNARGVNDAGAMALGLYERIPVIDAFISSPALRAKSTAEKFMTTFGIPKELLVTEHGLYLAPATFFTRFISMADDQRNTMAVFSHNPGITDYANTLTSAVRTDNIPTCGIFAVVADIDSWKNFEAASKTFLFYDYPKLHG